MQWQYRTILFEFTKDGLLGDKYVDDEEMEKTLNEMGKKGWELVNVALLQDGLLTFLKLPRIEEDAPAIRMTEPVVHSEPADNNSLTAGPSLHSPVIGTAYPDSSRESITAERIQDEERTHIEDLERQRKDTMKQQEMDFIGGIRIS